jgi:hypothetical protein
MRKIIYIILMTLVVACSKPERVSDNEPMLIFSMTKSGVQSGSDTPVFLFWLKNDFENISADNYTQPYLDSWAPDEIDAYKTTTYNTGKKYPDNDEEVFCTGYYPASLIIDGGLRPRSWTSLDVPEEKIGRMDVMVAPEHITGKSTAHFDTKEPGEPLSFVHAQSKVTFKAKMGTEMAQNRYLRNIKVTVPGSELMSSLKWESGRYTADGTAGEDVSVVLVDPVTTQLDPSQKPREIGDVLIYPGKSSLSISVNVEMSDSPLFPNHEVISITTEIPFNFTDGQGDVLGENEAYEIILVINYDSIVLKGRKAEWEEGGELLIPLYPNI